jgi:hypothetical protein
MLTGAVLGGMTGTAGSRALSKTGYTYTDFALSFRFKVSGFNARNLKLETQNVLS